MGGGRLAPSHISYVVTRIGVVGGFLRRTLLFSFCKRLLASRRGRVCRRFTLRSLSLDRVTRVGKVDHRNMRSLIGQYRGALRKCRVGLRLMRGFLSIGRGIDGVSSALTR